MRHSGCPHLTLGRARRLLVTRFHVARDDANMCKRAGFTVNGVERIPSNATSPYNHHLSSESPYLRRSWDNKSYTHLPTQPSKNMSGRGKGGKVRAALSSLMLWTCVLNAVRCL